MYISTPLLYPFFSFLGYLRCTQVEVVVNRTALNVGVLVAFCFWSSQVIGPVVGLRNLIVAQFLLLNVPAFCSHYLLLPFVFPPAARGYTVL